MQRVRRVHAAVIELDALADAIRTGAENHDLRFVGWLRLVFLFVSRIEIRRVRLELSAACVDALINGNQAERLAVRAHFVFGAFGQISETTIRESSFFKGAEQIERDTLERGYALVPRANLIIIGCRDDSVPRHRLYLALNLHHLLQLIEKPWIDLRQTIYFIDRPAVLQRVSDVRETLRIGPRQ